VIEKVIDSSILAKYILKEKGWENIRDILIEKPYTLELAIKETVNAIWKRVYLLRDISIEKARILTEDLIVLSRNLRIEDQNKYLQKAIEISIKYGITIYDSLFIALAYMRKAELITSDKKQFEIAKKMGIKAVLL
jgi:predicted nucleic acid-binding protein